MQLFQNGPELQYALLIVGQLKARYCIPRTQCKNNNNFLALVGSISGARGIVNKYIDMPLQIPPLIPGIIAI